MPTVNKSYASPQNSCSEYANYTMNDSHITTLNSTYTQAYCHQLEMAYGNHMMSEGGEVAIHKMFVGVPLEGKQVLDFGAGLGGVGFYLAKYFGAFMKGIEINPYMVEEATRRTPDSLKDKVSFFLIGSDQKFPFPDKRFDVVYSKGIIVHLKEEQRDMVFQELYRVLQPNGTLLIYDWVSPVENQWGKKVQDLIETQSLSLFAHSPASYEKELVRHGFSAIESCDRSAEFAAYNHEIVERLRSPDMKQFFIDLYGEETFQDHVREYKNMRDLFLSGELINLAIRAKKETTY